MRRWSYILRVAAVFCLLLAAVAIATVDPSHSVHADGVTVSIDAPAEVAEGKTFIAKLGITNVTDFDACNYDVSYDNSVLEVTDVSSGIIGGTVIPVDMWAEITLGTVRVIQNVPGTAGVSGSGYLAEIHFHVIGSACNTSTIDLHDGVLGDKSAQEISATWVDGSVHINTVLNAGFSADITEALVGQTITFTDATSGGTPPYTYAWDFDNDGVVDPTPESPTHSYDAAGTYTVALTVTDAIGDSDTETKLNYVTIYPSLEAGFSVSDNKGLAGITVFTFTDVTSGGKPSYTYAWDFDDDGVVDSTAASPSHTYAATGTYTVTLAVTDALGNSATKTIDITIYPLGDASEDGKVDAVDITKVELIIMGQFPYTAWADANQDSKVNALDITAVEIIIMTP